MRTSKVLEKRFWKHAAAWPRSAKLWKPLFWPGMSGIMLAAPSPAPVHPSRRSPRLSALQVAQLSGSLASSILLKRNLVLICVQRELQTRQAVLGRACRGAVLLQQLKVCGHPGGACGFACTTACTCRNTQRHMPRLVHHPGPTNLTPTSSVCQPTPLLCFNLFPPAKLQRPDILQP